MEITTTEYTTRTGEKFKVYDYGDRSFSVDMVRGNLDASIYSFPDKDTGGVVQDESQDETTSEAYTSYEKDDLKRVLLARVLNQPLQGADDIMADCFLAYLSIEIQKERTQTN